MYRKVAQYLKGKSSVTPISEDLSGDLILNKLLEGKTRKVCARMFFETLVSSCKLSIQLCGLRAVPTLLSKWKSLGKMSVYGYPES